MSAIASPIFDRRSRACSPKTGNVSEREGQRFVGSVHAQVAGIGPEMTRKMTILAHRGNTLGPDPARENTLVACAAALADGFGLEIDLRRDHRGRFLISHDPTEWTPGSSIAGYTHIFAKYPERVIAVNVKELGYLEMLINEVTEGTFGRCAFLFDFELLEPANKGSAQRTIRSFAASCAVTLASRMSDRGEPIEECLAIPGEIVWADEFDRPWLTKQTIDRVHAAGRQVYVVSPEIHGADRATRLARWAALNRWEVDGLCTDFAGEARVFFNR